MAIMCVLMQTILFHLHLRRCLHNQPIHFWEEDNVSMPAHMHMYAHSFVLSLPNTSLYVHMYIHSSVSRNFIKGGGGGGAEVLRIKRG